MKNIFRYLLISVFLFFVVFGLTSFKTTVAYTLTQYVEKYKLLAVEEMHRSGIPASITMAQAILESGYGNSYLAKNANNHFGIMNKPEWKGETFAMGGAVYKKYKTVLESYQDHSNHIKSRKWYAELFKLKITDYKNWAHGLKKAGYAQDPNYAYRLIQIIEKYKFSDLDLLYTPPVTVSSDK